jgi:hypothetical protein
MSNCGSGSTSTNGAPASSAFAKRHQNIANLSKLHLNPDTRNVNELPLHLRLEILDFRVQPFEYIGSSMFLADTLWLLGERRYICLCPFRSGKLHVPALENPSCWVQ